jgi:hypothetical protein
MDSDGTPQEQQERAPEEQKSPKWFSPRRAKEKCEAYAKDAYIRSKEWLKRPWWFQETDEVAKFTGWVAAYTGILVVVSALQFCTLQNTDKTTRDALIAANRAWVSPITVSVPSLPSGQGFDVSIQYQNTGREPALDLLIAHVINTYSKEEWTNGMAAKSIVENANSCFKIKKLGERTQAAFPSSGLTGSGYTLKFNTTEEFERIKITSDDIASGDRIFVVQWCFSYLSLNEVHHSTSCNFYQAKISNLPVLNICTVGTDAD